MRTNPMPKSQKKILISGGAGFIGLHLGRLHLEQGDKLTLIDNFFRGKDDADLHQVLKHKDVKFIRCDLTKPEEWQKLKGGYDYLYHLAAVNGTDLFYKIPH